MKSKNSRLSYGDIASILVSGEESVSIDLFSYSYFNKIFLFYSLFADPSTPTRRRGDWRTLALWHRPWNGIITDYWQLFKNLRNLACARLQDEMQTKQAITGILIAIK